MIATLSMTLQRGLPVNLPEAGSATDKVPELASITLTAKGELFFNKDPIGLVDLESRLAEEFLILALEQHRDLTQQLRVTSAFESAASCRGSGSRR